MRASADHVRTPFSRRLYQSESEQVTSNEGLGASSLDLLGDRLPVTDLSVDVRVLDQASHELLLAQLLDLLLERVVALGDLNLDSETARSRLEHRESLGGNGGRDEEYLLALGKLGLGNAGKSHSHSLSCRRGLVKERGVGNGKTGETGSHGLVVDQ